MPLTSKGEEIKKSMEKTYGSAKKADQVFYASKNAGKITGVDEGQSGMVTTPNAAGAPAGRPKPAKDTSGGTSLAGARPTMPTWPGRVV
jgi:hypothetical protein